MNAPLWSSVVLLSIKVALLATVLNLPAGLLISYALTRCTFKGKAVLEGIIQLPLVMPPVTTGYLLLLILGREGLLGAPLFQLFGIRIAFTTAAAVLAAMVVSFPLLVRSIRLSMDMVDPRYESAGNTLGAGKWEVFRRITFPLILPGILNGAVLGFARSLGEFGATMIFAGNLQGKTRTIPLAVYSALQVPGKEREAILLVAFSASISFIALFLSSRIKPLQQRASL